MKKIILSLTIILCCVVSRGQITLDTIVNGFLGHTFKTVQISPSETKWFFADTLNNTFSLYDMDFTPFLTNIAVPEPFAPSTSFMQVLYITRTLFDCDSANIEYAYYSPKNIGKPFKVLRTDGTLLFQKDSANGGYTYGGALAGTDYVRPIVNTSAGAKLFLQPFPLLLPIYVYSLCGTLPVDVFDFTTFNQSYVEVFPNPSSQTINFRVYAPDNINKYELVLLDGTGQEMIRKEVQSFDTLSIDVSSFSSGGYLYSLSSKTKSLQSGKFLITK